MIATLARELATESKQATLPSTGEVTSIMGLIGIGLMGLAPKARKRK
ncbi:TPA: LPXTG cell wall anchor domain-containing protein [Streptococcus suis]